ncbi:hypothetical protein D3C71_1518860 [compost metagenome]
MRRFQLDQLQVFRVFSHVQNGWQQANTVFQFDQVNLLQQQQGAAQIGWIVWQRNLRTVFQFVQRFDLLGVTGNRVNEGVADRYQLVAAIFDLLIQIRFVLEGVQIDVAFTQCFVR